MLMKTVKSIRILSLSILLMVASAGLWSAFAADVNDVYNLLNNTTNVYLNTIKNSVGNSDTKLSNIYSDIHTYLPSLQTITNQSQQYLFAIANSTQTLVGDIHNTNGIVNSSLRSIDSSNELIRQGLSYYLPDLRQLKEVLASDEDLAIRQGQAQRTDQISDDFLDASGDASVSLGDIGAAKDSIVALKDAFAGGASSSQLFTVLGSNSDGWGWFSQAVADDLDQSGSGSRLRGSSTPYLDDYYNQVYQALGGNYYD